MSHLKETPLFSQHTALNAKMTDFGGWALPAWYISITEEHAAVRGRAGLFDVSHMGELFIAGPQAYNFLQYAFTNDFTNMQRGSCRYTPLCYANGGTVDDVLVYKRDEQNYLVVVNAANTDKDYLWLQEHQGEYDVRIENASPLWTQMALQGPLAEDILAPLCEGSLPQKNYTFVEDICIQGQACLISRTGYTGEDGFEIYTTADGGMVYETILRAGAPKGLLPCGLGARDTLRFESSMPLYGHELSKDITPLEAGLDFAVKLNKDNFIGKEALLAAPRRRRIGLKLLERGVARENAPVCRNGIEVGFTTSGAPALTLGGSYAMALVEDAADETHYTIAVRGRELLAERVPMPFYARKQS
ncbi:MAG: glycine cleavage system aminomethyltransferase GcvT [Clostridiales bacterium]|nr:glycine cleavage system aminomethyltransferase GcvT [Clostridiales bacterium]